MRRSVVLLAMGGFLACWAGYASADPQGFVLPPRPTPSPGSSKAPHPQEPPQPPSPREPKTITLLPGTTAVVRLLPNYQVDPAEPTREATITRSVRITKGTVTRGEFRIYCIRARVGCEKKYQGNDQNPAAGISYIDAINYISWLNGHFSHVQFRLPYYGELELAFSQGHGGEIYELVDNEDVRRSIGASGPVISVRSTKDIRDPFRIRRSWDGERDAGVGFRLVAEQN